MVSRAKQFAVALSFPGEYREFVAEIASGLAKELGKGKILYDKYIEYDLGRADLDTYLQKLYHDESELVVVFLCEAYEVKEWTGVEWTSIRDRLKKKEFDQVMLLRLDQAPVTGVWSNGAGLDVSTRSPEEVVKLILERLAKVRRVGAADENQGLDLQSVRPFTDTIARTALFESLDSFARVRDIVFAVGGVGSGLTTFLHQFQGYLSGREDRQLALADFEADVYQQILEFSLKQREALKEFDFFKETGYDHLKLKCLLTALAYKTYECLHLPFRSELDREFPSDLDNPIRFAGYYFNASASMFQGDAGAVVEHFFETVQRLAESTHGKRVVVFMPWSQLATCFDGQIGTVEEALARELWEALGRFAARNGCPRGNGGDYTVERGFEKYDKVCLIVATSKVPYAHVNGKELLVRKSVWPIPPLRRGEILDLVEEVLPTLAREIEGEEVVQLVYEWTGGSPWFVSLILSFLEGIVAGKKGMDEAESKVQLLATACGLAEEALVSPEEKLAGDLGGRVKRHLLAVIEALGDGQSTDAKLEEAWAGPEYKWKRGVMFATPRVEEFVASGLVWLRGDPSSGWEESEIFEKYPTLFFRRAGRLQVVVYNKVTGRDIRRVGF